MAFKLDLAHIAKAAHGKVLAGEDTLLASGVGTDTREDLSGQLFVALKGDSFDAHDFLEQAVDKGAAALLVNDNLVSAEKIEQLTAKNPNLGIIGSQDTLKSMQDLAHEWRVQCGFKVVGITGSNGKTTTKEFLNTILSQKYKVVASPGSFNNHWGVPMSLLMADEETEFAIIEMGMNHTGEITQLCKIAEPDFTLVTTVGTAHIGELGSIENIATAKSEIYEASPKSLKVFNADNEYTLEMLSKAKETDKRLWSFSSFSKSLDAHMRAEKMQLKGLDISGQVGGEEFSLNVPVFGRHNVTNLMGASCLALACGMNPAEIISALPKCKTIWGRNQLIELKNGAYVLFDAYNANFDSMSGLIKTLFEFDLPAKKYAVLGQMLELGHESESLHNELGQLVGRTGFEGVWFIGDERKAFESGLKSEGFSKKLIFSDTYKESLAKDLGSMLNTGDVVIIKGSRGMKLEQVLEQFEAM